MRPTGNRNLVAPKTHVGDDACIVPHTSRHRKHPGRDKSRPYKPSEHDRPNRTGATTQASVGRDALIPPHPAAAQTPAGGINPAPTVNGRVHDQPGNRGLVAPQTHVGDDACIVPGTLLHRKVPGRDKSLPYKPSEHDSPNRDGRNHPGVRRAGCPHPAAPRGGANTRGRIWNPPLRTTANAAANRENAVPALQQTPVGDDACTAPAGAFRRPTGPQARLLGRRSSREPCGGANTRGRIWNPPLRNGRGCGRIRAPPLRRLPAFRRGGGGAAGTKI